jgi:hypothetical protein
MNTEYCRWSSYSTFSFRRYISSSCASHCPRSKAALADYLQDVLAVELAVQENSEIRVVVRMAGEG